jgi:hypothetical protein
MLSAAHATGHSRNIDFISDIGTCSISSSIHVIAVLEQELQLGDKAISESAGDLIKWHWVHISKSIFHVFTWYNNILQCLFPNSVSSSEFQKMIR